MSSADPLEPERAPAPEPIYDIFPADSLGRDDLPAPEPPIEVFPAEPPELPPANGGGERPRRPRPPYPNFWWGLLWCLAFLLFVNLFPISILVPTALVKAALSGNAQYYLNHLLERGKPTAEFGYVLGISILGTELAAVVLVWLLVRWVVGPHWRRRLAVRTPSLPQLVLALAGLPAMALSAIYLHAFAHQYLPSFGLLEGNSEMFGSLPLWLGVAGIGLGPGIAEEFFCRGFLGRGFVGNYGWLVGVLLTSLCFGVLHLDPPYIVATAFMGLCLHYVYWTSRSLPLSMLVHAANNSLAIVLDQPGIKERFDPIEQAAIHPLIVAAVVVLLLAVAAALYEGRARLVGLNGLPPWRPVYPGVADPPPDSGTRVVWPWPGLLSWALVAAAAVQFVLAYRFVLDPTRPF
jgi:membrane protease YdiL (CAAX protease family)